MGHVGDVAPPPLEGGGAERSFPGVPPMEGMRPGDPGKILPGVPPSSARRTSGVVGVGGGLARIPGGRSLVVTSPPDCKVSPSGE